MNVSITLATASRVLHQLRRDPRTVALVLVVPPGLLTLFRYVFDGQPATFNRIGAPLVGIFPLVSMFLVTSIAMLRERTTGTLERLMSMPLAKADLLLGYGIAYAVVAAVQATITSAVAFGLLGLDVAGDVWLVVLLAIANALLGVALGLFLSAFATTEFQAVQFMPAVLLPQLLLCGLIVPRERMASLLEAISDVLPIGLPSASRAGSNWARRAMVLQTACRNASPGVDCCIRQSLTRPRGSTIRRKWTIASSPRPSAAPG
jgi:ABC-2 type transport system permease protein